MPKAKQASETEEPIRLEEINVKTIEAPYLSAGVIFTDEFTVQHAGIIVGVGKDMTKEDDPLTVNIAKMMNQTTSGTWVVKGIGYSAEPKPNTWRWPK